MTPLKIDVPDQIFQILEEETKQRKVSIDNVVAHHLSSSITLMNKIKRTKEWLKAFFENTAGSWQGEPLKREGN